MRKKQPAVVSGEGRAERGGETRQRAPLSVQSVSPVVKVEPLRDLLVVRPETPRGLTSQFLTVVSDQQQPAVRGMVLAVGPEVRDVRVGQRVVFSRLQGYHVDINEPLILISESAILATE